MTQYCTFRLDGHLFGVPVASVQEVLRPQERHRGPARGACGLRPGQPAWPDRDDPRPAHPARDRRSGPPGPRPSASWSARSTATVVSLVVDEIGDVLEPAAEVHETPPDTVAAHVRELVTSVCKLEDELLLVLDTERATTVAGAADPAAPPRRPHPDRIERTTPHHREARRVRPQDRPPSPSSRQPPGQPPHVAQVLLVLTVACLAPSALLAAAVVASLRSVETTVAEAERMEATASAVACTASRPAAVS